LQNDGVLPLSRGMTVAVVGPNANATDALLGNYHGTPAFVVSPLQAIADTAAAVRSSHVGRTAVRRTHHLCAQVLYAPGCAINSNDTSGFADAEAAARASAVVVLVLGLDLSQEAEGLDRTSIELPGVQLQLAQRMVATGTPVVVVFVSGGALAAEWVRDNAAAVLAAFYGGEYGGQAIADVVRERSC
jgi:beta-glucosidase